MASTSRPDAPPVTDSAPQKATVLDAVRTIDPLSDLQRLPNMPCARYSLLFGIVAGVSVGAMRFIFSRTGRRGSLRGGTESPWSEVAVAANWAVGAWGVGSLGAWETCRARQTSEAARMQALVSEIKSRRASRSEHNSAHSSDPTPWNGHLSSSSSVQEMASSHPHLHPILFFLPSADAEE
ncbi:hypothetical protein JCM10908_007048 [Rhodotorula pacifica]|uniref:Cox20p n=1 Tax=Rhodotorula pacifica TaxID=1495444 RepID=UPI0031779422